VSPAVPINVKLRLLMPGGATPNARGGVNSMLVGD